MGTGWKNPLPLRVGGAPTGVELAYEAIRRAHGRGPSGGDAIGPRDGLRDLWTKCEALAIAASQSTVEHAFWQAFPHTMTSHLEVWEGLLHIPMGDNMVVRQREVVAAYTRVIDATIPGIRAALRQIDINFDVDIIPDAEKTTTIAGKEFGPLPGAVGAPYGTGQAVGRFSSAYPNYSDDFIVRVRYVLQGGMTEIPLRALADAEDLLNEVLPAWVDFEIYDMSSGADGDGFYFDGGPNDDSLLDQTAMTP